MQSNAPAYFVLSILYDLFICTLSWSWCVTDGVTHGGGNFSNFLSLGLISIECHFRSNYKSGAFRINHLHVFELSSCRKWRVCIYRKRQKGISLGCVSLSLARTWCHATSVKPKCGSAYLVHLSITSYACFSDPC